MQTPAILARLGIAITSYGGSHVKSVVTTESAGDRQFLIKFDVIEPEDTPLLDRQGPDPGQEAK